MLQNGFLKNIDTLPVLLRRFLDDGLVISPWLAGVNGNGRFDAAVFEFLDSEARELADTQWTEQEQVKAFGSLAAPERLARTAIYEIAASTAVSLTHEESGSTWVEEESVRVALHMVREFCAEFGASTLLQLYSVATGYENLQAVAHYGQMPERDFVLGRCHRPWVDYSLSDELLLGVVVGNYRIGIVDGRRVVSLTDQGVETYRKVEQILDEAGYLSHRVRQLHVSRFNLLDNFDQLSREVSPDWMPQRRTFLEWVGVRPGMRVLELGCASGGFTFEGGLAERVGPDGQVIAVDPARSMLARAETRRNQFGFDWVSFLQGRAEDLPFADESFDAVVGVAFLHFTDMPRALKEMRRVTRSGGFVGCFNPVSFQQENPFLEHPFFREWFAPLQKLALSRHEDRPRDFLSSPAAIHRHFAEAGLVDIRSALLESRNLFPESVKVIDIYIRGVGLFQEELATIPWKAREDLIAQLEDNGRIVCKKYPESERIVRFPQMMISGAARR
ncbi:MAG: methyltransferase domain-containing protein [Bacilli bacterium]